MTITPLFFDPQADPSKAAASVTTTPMEASSTIVTTTTSTTTATATESAAAAPEQQITTPQAEIISPTSGSSTLADQDVETGLEETISSPFIMSTPILSEEEEEEEQNVSAHHQESPQPSRSTQQEVEEQERRRGDDDNTSYNMTMGHSQLPRWKSVTFSRESRGISMCSSISNGSNNRDSSSDEDEDDEDDEEGYDTFDPSCLPSSLVQRTMAGSMSSFHSDQDSSCSSSHHDGLFVLGAAGESSKSSLIGPHDGDEEQHDFADTSGRSVSSVNSNSSSTTTTRSRTSRILKPAKLVSQRLASTTKNVIVQPAAAVTTRVSSSISHASERVSSGADKHAGKIVEKVFGDEYSKREAFFVTIMGFLIAFNNGMVNGATVSGLVNSEGLAQSVSGFTGDYTKSALAFAGGEWSAYGYSAFLIMSYAAGAFISGILNPHATPYQLNPMYGPTFMIGGGFLMAAAVSAWFDHTPRIVFFLAAASNGVQNGIASIYSKNLIRVSMTGATTDLSVCIGQFLRGDKKRVHKSIVLVVVCIGFWTGGLISFWMTQKFLTHTLFINAGLYLFIGIALVWFLVTELHVSIEAAIRGTWQWKGAMSKLAVAAGSTPSTFFGTSEKTVASSCADDTEISQIDRAMELFDFVDRDGDGEIDPAELLEALISSGTRVTTKQVKILIKSADANGDGLIDREEWMAIVKKLGI